MTIHWINISNFEDSNTIPVFISTTPTPRLIGGAHSLTKKRTPTRNSRPQKRTHKKPTKNSKKRTPVHKNSKKRTPIHKNSRQHTNSQKQNKQ